MLLEHIKPGQPNIVFIPKESMAKYPVDFIDSIELMLFHFCKMRYNLLGYMKFCSAIFSAIQPFMLTDINNVIFLRNGKRRINTNSLKSMQLLRIHRPH